MGSHNIYEFFSRQFLLQAQWNFVLEFYVPHRHCFYQINILIFFLTVLKVVSSSSSMHTFYNLASSSCVSNAEASCLCYLFFLFGSNCSFSIPIESSFHLDLSECLQSFLTLPISVSSSSYLSEKLYVDLVTWTSQLSCLTAILCFLYFHSPFFPLCHSC